VTYRLTDPSQLAHVSPWARAQLERHLAGVPQAAGATVARISEQLERDKPRLNQAEQEEGKLLVQWIDSVVLPNGLRPGLFFAHVANAGVAGGKVRGGILQGQGVRAGWPDYTLDLPMGRYHGFRLELKRVDGNKPSPEQLETLERLESVGYKVAVAWGFEEARRAVSAYLGIPY
jgi:hypothetical protein